MGFLAKKLEVKGQRSRGGMGTAGNSEALSAPVCLCEREVGAGWLIQSPSLRPGWGVQ